jgi:hypothetical protein
MTPSVPRPKLRLRNTVQVQVPPLAVAVPKSPARAKQQQRRQQARLSSSLTRLHTTDTRTSTHNTCSTDDHDDDDIPRTTRRSSFQVVAAASSSLGTASTHSTHSTRSTCRGGGNQKQKQRKTTKKSKSCAAAVTHGMPKTITPATLKAQSHKPLRRASRRRTNPVISNAPLSNTKSNTTQAAALNASLLFARDNDHVPVRPNKNQPDNLDNNGDDGETWYPGYQPPPPPPPIDKRSKYKAMLATPNDTDKKKNQTSVTTSTASLATSTGNRETPLKNHHHDTNGMLQANDPGDCPTQVVESHLNVNNNPQEPMEQNVVINDKPNTSGNWLLLEDFSDMEDDNENDHQILDMDTSSNSRHNFLRNQYRYGNNIILPGPMPLLMDDLLMNASFATLDTLPTNNKFGTGCNDYSPQRPAKQENKETTPGGVSLQTTDSTTKRGDHPSENRMAESIMMSSWIDVPPCWVPDAMEPIGKFNDYCLVEEGIAKGDDAEQEIMAADPPAVDGVLDYEGSRSDTEVNTVTTLMVDFDGTVSDTECQNVKPEASVESYFLSGDDNMDAIARALVLARGGSNSMNDRIDKGQLDECNQQSDITVTDEAQRIEVEMEPGNAESMTVASVAGQIEAGTSSGALEVLNKTQATAGPIHASDEAALLPVEPMTRLIPDPSLEIGAKVAMDTELVAYCGAISIIAKEPHVVVGDGAPVDTTNGSHDDGYQKSESQVVTFSPETSKIDADELPQSPKQGPSAPILDGVGIVVDSAVTDVGAVIIDGSSKTVSAVESATEQPAILRQNEEKEAATGCSMLATSDKGMSLFAVDVGDKAAVTIRSETDDDEKTLEEKAKKWAKARRAKFGSSTYPASSRESKSKDSAGKAKKKKRPGPTEVSGIPRTSFLGEVAAVMNAKNRKEERNRPKKTRNNDGEDLNSTTTRARERKKSTVAKAGVLAVAPRSENRTESESSRRANNPPTRSPASQNRSCAHQGSSIDSSSSRSKTPRRRPSNMEMSSGKRRLASSSNTATPADPN